VHGVKVSAPMPNQAQEVSCLGKQRFDSMQLAVKVAGRKGRAEKLGAYRCAYCRGFHLGHHSNGKRVGR
jgi:hypothetical protein